MATPYTRAPGPHLAGATGPGRPPLVRPLAGRWLGGVCAGVALHLGVDVRGIRIALVILGFLGPGLPAYLFLWALVPAAPVPDQTLVDPRSVVDLADPRMVDTRSVVGGADRLEDDRSAEPSDPGTVLAERHSLPGASTTALGDARPALSTPVERALHGMQRSRAGAIVAVGILVVAVGALVALSAAGLDVRASLLVPLVVVAAGAVVVWSDLDESTRWLALGAGEGQKGWVWLRVGLGMALAVVGLVLLVVRGASITAAFDAILAAVAVLAGVGLILAPWVLRLWANARREQAEAAQATARADIAAHLHDSVLQTLALIQRSSHDPTRVTLLARAQERELRQWLYAAPTGSQETLAAAVTAVAHEVEDLHGQPVEVVVTGDRPLDVHGQALTRALREALLNAVRHGRPPVAAYVEIGVGGVEAFVRDHGDGFDPEDVPEDRLGVRRSIVERMARHSGSARVRRLESGTEVELTLPPLEGDHHG